MKKSNLTPYTMRYYRAEVLAVKAIKENYIIIADTIGDAEDKAYALFGLRHPKSQIISLDVTPMIIHGIIS